MLIPLGYAIATEAIHMKVASIVRSVFTVKAGDTAWALSGGKCLVPNLIYPGQKFNARLCIATPAMPQRVGSANVVKQWQPDPQSPASVAVVTGYYGDPGLSDEAVGQLWVSVGGPASQEQTAECIAWHESGDRPDAISPSDDSGLWQINIVNAPTLAMENPIQNAEEAVKLWEDDGWSPWTTAPDCGV